MVKGEHVCITSTGWTYSLSETYMSLTVSLVTFALELITLSIYRKNPTATRIDKALAAGITAAAAKHDISGTSTSITTDRRAIDGENGVRSRRKRNVGCGNQSF